jgi:hypothetical protein
MCLGWSQWTRAGPILGIVPLRRGLCSPVLACRNSRIWKPAGRLPTLDRRLRDMSILRASSGDEMACRVAAVRIGACMWVTWHGMAWHGMGKEEGRGGGTARQIAKAEACRPRLLAFGFWVESFGGAKSMRLTWIRGCTRHNNMAQFAPWRARSSKK